VVRRPVVGPVVVQWAEQAEPAPVSSGRVAEAIGYYGVVPERGNTSTERPTVMSSRSPMRGRGLARE
jgi:hypothetical protein